ncbi:MAG: hypothetical protein JWP74_2435 [Marmoricola sp.]|nr:hypothetical protein [Marmoricola sp.]
MTTPESDLEDWIKAVLPPDPPLTPEQRVASDQLAADLQAKIAAIRLERDGPPEPVWPADVLLPDLRSDYAPSESAQAVDDACDSITIFEVYDRLSKGQYDNPRSIATRDEGIQISCPIPGHRDNNPSAAINKVKQVWMCYRCGEGGNKYTIAGYAYGLDPKPGGQFWEIKVRMAEEFRGVAYNRPQVSAPTTAPATSQPQSPQTALPEPVRVAPSYKIQDVLPNGDSFLRAYYDATSVDQTPSEYQLWCGLVALAVAIGRRVTLVDSIPVTANLGICLIGMTATGKSRSMRHVEDLLGMDPRLHWHPGNELGVKIRQNPGSGPYLIEELVDDEKVSGSLSLQHPVKILISQDEISSLIRKGNSRESNHGVREVVLQLLDGKRRLHHGSKTGGNFEALDSFGVLLGATQPEVVPTLFSDEDMVTGFMNRLIFVPGEPVKRSHRSATPVDLTDAHEHLNRIVDWSAQGIEIEDWADDADALWKEAFELKVEPLQRDRRWNKILGRLDLTMKRLILLFAANNRSSSIQLEHVQSALALLDYLIECYQQLVENLETTDIDQVWVRIAKACLKLQGSPDYEGHAPISQVQRTVNKTGWQARHYTETIDAMVDGELVETYEHTKASGRKIKCFRLTPLGLSLAA